MPLRDFFSNQIQQLRDFFDDPAARTRLVFLGDEMRPMLQKVLIKIDEQPDNLHVLQYVDAAFEGPASYAEAILSDVVEQNELFRLEFDKRSLEFPSLESLQIERPANSMELIRYLEAAASSLEHRIGSYVLWLSPPEIAVERPFAELLGQLTQQVNNPWVKFLVPVPLDSKDFEELQQSVPGISSQCFHLAPDEIEKKVNADLASGALPVAQKAKYAAMSGAFAFAHRRYDEAAKVQQEVLQLARQAQNPSDEATALYNLGNTQLAQENYDEALTTLNSAAQICLQHEMNPLLGMVLCNLGVALQRVGEVDHALEALDTSQRTFAAMGNVAAEAHVCDCKAKTLALANRTDQAEAAWRQALSKYDAITSPAMEDVRKAGRSDVLDKMKRFFESTGQQAKLQQLQAAESRS